MKRRALAAVPLALGLAALLLVPAWLCGCGKKEQPPRERLEAAAEAAREAGSAHAQLFVSVSPREGERGTSMNVQGDVWADMQAGNMEARLTVLGMEVAARYVEGRAYVRFGGQWYVLEGEIAQGVDEEAVTALAGLLGAAPEIVSAAEEVEKVGERKVGDDLCEVFSVKPDLPAIAALPAVREVGAALGMSEEEVVEYLEDAGVTMEVCVRKDAEIIRQVVATADVELPDLGEVAGIPLLPESAHLEITVDFPAFGVEVNVQVPPDARSIRDLL